MKFYTSVAKGLKQKVKRFWGLIPTFVEVTREKLEEGRGGEGGWVSPSLVILNRVKQRNIRVFLARILKSSVCGLEVCGRQIGNLWAEFCFFILKLEFSTVRLIAFHRRVVFFMQCFIFTIT